MPKINISRCSVWELYWTFSSVSSQEKIICSHKKTLFLLVTNNVSYFHKTGSYSVLCAFLCATLYFFPCMSFYKFCIQNFMFHGDYTFYIIKSKNMALNQWPLCQVKECHHDKQLIGCLQLHQLPLTLLAPKTQKLSYVRLDIL